MDRGIVHGAQWCGTSLTVFLPLLHVMAGIRPIAYMVKRYTPYRGNEAALSPALFRARGYHIRWAKI
eukprot:3931878-Pyramimonas_sp.AAC.1